MRSCNDFVKIFNMDKKIETFVTIHGELSIDIIADAKMAAIFARGEYHQNDTIEILSAFVTPKSIFVDGGAHIGTLAIPLARKAKQTIAYEADAYTCDILRKNVEQNGVSVDVRQNGIGREASQGEMVSVRDGNAGAHTLIVGTGGVVVVKLDDELQHVDVLKLDVEGMELDALLGAQHLIEMSHPVVLFEVNISQLRVHGTSIIALGAFFQERNYYLYLPFRMNGTLVLGSVHSVSLIALLYYPGAFIFHRTSSVFDIIAVPIDMQLPLPTVSAWRTVAYVFTENIQEKINRIRKIFAL